MAVAHPTPDLTHRIAVAAGREPADLVLRNARLINVLSQEIYETDIVVAGQEIAALGTGYTGRAEVDLGGRYVCPGFIDAHVHIESSLCTPTQFARALLARGVCAVVADPHEIANVFGLAGVRFMLESARATQMDVYVMAPSCVPATHLETGGARLDIADLQALAAEPEVLGLAEVMNYPAVVAAAPEMMAKLAVFDSMLLDGHAPEVTGQMLAAYAAAGISTDHEATGLDEAREKLRLGMRILIREGSATPDLLALLPLVTPANHHRFAFCTDDRQPDDLSRDGSVDHMVRQAVAAGLDPLLAISLGSINAADHYGLSHLGAIAPGRLADLVVFSDLSAPRAESVYRRGTLVAKDGVYVGSDGPAAAPGVPAAAPREPIVLPPSMHLAGPASLAIPAAAGASVRVIEAVSGQLATGHAVVPATVVDGHAVADPARDLLKMAVLERHHGTGNVGLGFISGFGLRSGAMASTFAHDHHNLIVIGADDVSMATAVAELERLGGGQVVTDGAQVLAALPLPVAGIMSEEPIETVAAGYRACRDAARSLGCGMADPFMTLSFMALEAIPRLKLTDLGVVDVEAFALVDLLV